MDCLTEIAENSKDKPSQVEVFRDIILTLFNGFVHICNCLIEIVPVKVQNGSIVVKSRYVVVAQLGKMGYPNP